MIGHLNNEEIEAVLKQQIIGRLGCHLDGDTYIVPISYAYDDHYIYAHSAEGKKINIMRQNPNVCFEVDDINNMGNWKSVVATGSYEEVADPAERTKALRILLNRVLPLSSSITTHLGKHWPFEPVDLNSISGIVFRIQLKEKSGRFESNELTPSFTV